MAEILGNDGAIGPLIENLRTTAIGDVEGVYEGSKEWEDGVDREGEED